MCNTLHHRLIQPNRTAAVGQAPLQVSLRFIAQNQFPVAICMIATNAWPQQKFSIRSFVSGLRIRRRGLRTRINHRVSHPDAEMEAANKEVAEKCLSKAQVDFRKGSRL